MALIENYKGCGIRALCPGSVQLLMLWFVCQNVSSGERKISKSDAICGLL